MSRQQPPTSSSASSVTSGSSYAATHKTLTESNTALVSPPASTSEQAAAPGSQPKHGGARERLAALSKGVAQKMKGVLRAEEQGKDKQKAVPKSTSNIQPLIPMTEQQRMEQQEKTLASKFDKDMAFLQDQAHGVALQRQNPGQPLSRPLPPRQYYPNPRQRLPNPAREERQYPPAKDMPKPHKAKQSRRTQEEDSEHDFNFYSSQEEMELKGLSAPQRHHRNPPKPPHSRPPTGA